MSKIHRDTLVTERIGKVEKIMLKKAKIGLGVATIGMALSMVPAVTASASVSASATLRTSSLCKAYKADLKAASKSESASIEKAIESGNWPAAQKALLSAFNGESGLEKSLVASLASAPSKVKAAASVSLKFDATLKSLIQKSKSLTQYESLVTAASKNPKLAAAEKVLDAYTQKECPGLLPTTTTPTT
jgi:hypothetical protein